MGNVVLESNSIYLPKDFIQTSENLIFAVVQQGFERVKDENVVLCFLRYVKTPFEANGSWRKFNTDSANEYLKVNHPEYLHYSTVLDTWLHAVPVNNVVFHYHPRQRLQRLLSQRALDKVEQDCYELCGLFRQEGLNLAQFGVTGSLLIGAQKESSDIDLVIYDRKAFHLARDVVKKLIVAGKLCGLTEDDWQDAYVRRGCTLTYQEYVWHERRKYNKGMINGRKFDLGFLNPATVKGTKVYRKFGAITLKCKIMDGTYGFDYPANYYIDSPEASEIICFTATYVGQAKAGEMVEVSGMLEQSNEGTKRIIVGSSREALGEYIKIV